MDILDEGLSDSIEVAAIVTPSKQQNARTVLAELALLQALGSKGRQILASTTPIAVIVKVPSSQWVEPIKTALASVSKLPATFTTLPKRSSDRANVEAEVSSLLARGKRVIGVTPLPMCLPYPLLAAATHEFEVQAPSADLLASAMMLCLSGRLPKEFRTLNLNGLDFDAICACMPRGVTRAEAGVRVKKATERSQTTASAFTITLPSLEAAVEYGEAREWGLDLKRDINDVRTKKSHGMQSTAALSCTAQPGTGKTKFAKILGQSCGLTPW